MKTTKKIITTSIAVAMLATAPMRVEADWISEFYNSAGAGLNVTKAQAITTQSVTGGSGGSIAWRVPTKSFYPLQVTPPSIKAGCGGIDVYLGGYSFPNKEQFVQALRNYGQASLGYFFQLALKAMAPEIGATLDVINEMAQRVNQFGTNSCEAAQWTAGKMADMLPDYLIRENAGYVQAVGEVVDYFDGTQKVKGKTFSETLTEKYSRQYAKAKADLTKDDLKSKTMPPEFNLVWYALNNSVTASTFSDEEKELMLSMIGSEFIVRQTSGTQDANGTTLEAAGGVSATLTFEQLVGIDDPSAAASRFKTISCSDDPVLCLFPREATNLSPSLAQRAFSIMQKLNTAIVNRTPDALTDEENLMLRMSGQPLLKVASMAAGTGIGASTALGMQSTVAYSAAVEAGAALMLNNLTTVEAAIQALKPKLDANGIGHARHLEKKIADMRVLILMKVRTWNNEHNPMEKLEQLEKAERAMYSNLNRMLAANAKYLRH